ncbi:MAG: YkgJ family cysteine cluster protein [Planctomycetota bacterium]|nr:YkgJ family cysteine cluster protein [Planctomycetota bacterium]
MDRDRDAEGSTFVFSCRRSGRCCSLPGGFAFVDDGEVAALAAHLELTVEAFEQRFVREVTHPGTGERVGALRDRPDGACALLEGQATCGAYEARPRQCREFPHWDSVLDDPAGFARARQTCPGIEELPGPARRAEAARLWADSLADLPGGAATACPFDPSGPGPHVSGLELTCLTAGVAPTGSSFCPAREGDRCGAPERRPLACRVRTEAAAGTSEASAPALEDALGALEALIERLDWPRSQGPIGDLARRSALLEASAKAPLRLRFDPHRAR